MAASPSIISNHEVNGSDYVTDAVSLDGFSQGSLATSTTGAHTAALTGGTYDVWSAVDTYLKVASSASDVTTSTGYLLYANNILPLTVPSNFKIGAILSSGTSTLYYHRVK